MQAECKCGLGQRPSLTNLDISSHINCGSNAESNLRTGKCLILSGSVICLIGILAYCLLTLNQQAPTSEGLPLLEFSLAAIAGGFVCWLVGAIFYFNSAIDMGDTDILL